MSLIETARYKIGQFIGKDLPDPELQNMDNIKIGIDYDIARIATEMLHTAGTSTDQSEGLKRSLRLKGIEIDLK